MTVVHVLFGTESGNAEMAADDIAAAFGGQGFETVTTELTDIEVSDLPAMEIAVFVSSTYGEGGLPETAAPFYEALMAERPDLTGVRFAAFGLGDSVYETFNNAIETLRTALLELGAEQLGTTARHDAASTTPATDLAAAWARDLLALVTV
ncbi:MULTISPECIES: flavodoxin domain-containing protein [Streptomyces]|uniref:Flavodoxin domain-containing protein n=1 Tax=Streptomyces griseiscabiei TaxID=2993540 RepID=A0ABU4L6R7_9ACTN|nr:MULTISPECIES: flavodoxin domain-containing protein [Streptomyces]MBZ3906426.1 flavodoxin domain-containing protein [Streptomyces griseiscabiei]MDX2911421.1 flavodoxin domain-containing protein [Streptomyces griseiscabiei]